MKIRLITCILFLTLLFPIVKPENNSIINYIHVLFEWDEILDVSDYKLLVTSNNITVLDATTSNHFYIDEVNIEWESTYSWQVCDISNETNCSEQYTFSTGSEIDLGELNITVDLPQEYFDGVTIFGNLTPAFSAAIDKNGRQVWNSGGLNTFCYFNHDDENRFYGGEYSTDPINILPGIRFNIDGNILFEEPEIDINANYAFVQHEILQINDSQYLFLIPEDQLHPVPSCASTPGCTWPGGAYDWEDDFFEGMYVYWRGEKIILWDESTQTIQWEWNAFDHIPLNDYDALVNWDAYPTYGYYDWTHFNALAYDEDNAALYLSSRHLSRIYKISMETNEILWSMGYDLTGNGNVDIQLNDQDGNYNGFTFQHGLQILENGNIVTLDNGNISSLLFPNYSGVNKTRALEISIDQPNNTAEIIWEYILDENLYGALSGNVQKLDNGNYLITTIGDYGHTLEVNSDGELVSDLQYKIDNYVTGKMYRADRIKSIHPQGCIDLNACNYNINARFDDNSCEYTSDSSHCDCDGNVLDECGECGGPGPLDGYNCEGVCIATDSDADGICDSDDNCPEIPNSNQSNYDQDTLGDYCDDDDDDDGLLDCWDYWQADGILMTEDELVAAIENGDCEDYALSNNEIIIPNQINLLNIYPNPFNPTVNFNIEIDSPGQININTYSINGNLIESIYDGFISSGTHSFHWNAVNYPSGLYIINLTQDKNSISKKVVLLK